MRLSKAFCLSSSTCRWNRFRGRQYPSNWKLCNGQLNMGNSNTAMAYTGFSSRDVLTNPAPGSTFLLNPAGLWAAPATNSTWIGHTPSAAPAGINPPLGFYTFTTTGTYSGIATFWADVTTQVYRNGVQASTG